MERKLVKVVKVNFTDRKSIKNAERKKRRLENKGFTLTRTIQKGINLFLLEYTIKRGG